MFCYGFLAVLTCFPYELFVKLISFPLDFPTNNLFFPFLIVDTKFLIKIHPIGKLIFLIVHQKFGEMSLQLTFAYVKFMFLWFLYPAMGIFLVF